MEFFHYLSGAYAGSGKTPSHFSTSPRLSLPSEYPMAARVMDRFMERPLLWTGFMSYTTDLPLFAKCLTLLFAGTSDVREERDDLNAQYEEIERVSKEVEIKYIDVSGMLWAMFTNGKYTRGLTVGATVALLERNRRGGVIGGWELADRQSAELLSNYTDADLSQSVGVYIEPPQGVPNSLEWQKSAVDGLSVLVAEQRQRIMQAGRDLFAKKGVTDLERQ